MKRREFITLLGSAATWPLGVRAQQRALPVIGFLHVASAMPLVHLVAGLRRGLQEMGYAEGENLRIEYRWAEGHYDRLPALAADLVQAQVAVIVTGGGPPSALAAKAATATIPIVFNVSTDPVRMGLVASLGSPGGNATGINLFSSELESKRLGLLHEVAPNRSMIAYMVNPDYPPSESNIREVEAAALRLGHEILLLRATTATDIDAVFSTISQAIPAGLLVGADPFFYSRRAQILPLVARLAIPTIYEQREFALEGGLISYGTDLVDAYRLEGVYAARILKGEKPADLPIQQPTKFVFILNLKTAKTLGITFPSGVLAIADEVIE
jgi:putative tryptophan/tyrosine transport system substrate-binding protein